MTPNNTTWHADATLLAGYVGGTLGRAMAASVESHLLTCASCREALAPLVASDRLDRNLVAIAERVDRPEPYATGWVLERLGVPERLTRMLTITPAVRTAWVAGVAVALLVALLARQVNIDERTLFALLVAVPLLPLMGVSAAFASRADPAREIIVAAPTSALELFLIRALAVLAPAVGVAVAASVFVSGVGWEPALWLAPSLGLVATTLALGSWMSLRTSAWLVGAAWVLVSAVSVRGAPATDLIHSYAAFRPAGQLALMVVALASAAVVAVRRDTFELVDVWRTP
jgi:hypothetical protein